MTTTAEQADFMRAILANPEDDAPRLIYADWLDENANDSKCDFDSCLGIGTISFYDSPCPRCKGTGRISNGFAERAEFIRLSIKWHTFENNIKSYPNAIEYDDVMGRCMTLFRLYGEQWFGNNQFVLRDNVTPHVLDLGGFQRGFQSHASMTLAQFLQHSRKIAQRHPVAKWVLTDRKIGAYGVYWFADEPFDYVPDGEDWWLPWSLAQLLKGTQSKDPPNKNFHRHLYRYLTIADAMADLQQACYAYARMSEVCKTCNGAEWRKHRNGVEPCPTCNVLTPS